MGQAVGTIMSILVIFGMVMGLILCNLWCANKNLPVEVGDGQAGPSEAGRGGREDGQIRHSIISQGVALVM